MFCDLVGSTELSQQLDPEELRDINRAYQDCCKRAIERYEGYVARYMGDGVLAYFGYPQAHEDDAERAIHAGLGVVDAVSQLDMDSGELELSVRVGIATGPVVVGDLIAEGASQESAVVGETPNLAARLQRLADENAVVIGPGTHELASGRFEYTDLGSHSLKGIAESVQAWRVVAPITVESRFEATHRSGLTPLVGREHEIGLLLDRWEQAKEGDGQVVFLSGEAGIGKSRITETLRDRTASDHPVRSQYQCSPYYSNSALHPVIEQLERTVRFSPEDGAVDKLDKLESLLGTNSDDTAIPLLAALLSIPLDGRYPTIEMTPERQREATLNALVSQIEGAAKDGPVLLIVEDAHWSDPTTLDLLDLTISRVQQLPVLVIITFRPEFVPPWTGYTHGTTLALNRFARSLVGQMVERITVGKPIPVEVVQQIIEKTDGVPLFVEELTKTILESGQLVEESSRYDLSGPLSEITVPATLHDSLMARLDRLGSLNKEIAQIASAIGRDFDKQLLAAVHPLDPVVLQTSLNGLVAAGLVYRSTDPTGQNYTFKHALVQHTAYQSLLNSRRRELHEHIAKALINNFPQIEENRPELVARHLGEAKLIEEAVQYLYRAGERAAARCSYAEAVGNFSRGLELLSEFGNEEHAAHREIEIRLALHAPLRALEAAWSSTVDNNCKQALILCEQYGKPEQLFAILWVNWQSLSMQSMSREARGLADRLLTLSRELGDTSFALESRHCEWTNGFMLGDLPEIMKHTEVGIELYDPTLHGNLATIYGGHDPGVCAHQIRASALWLMGYPEQSDTHLDHGFELARQLGHRYTYVYSAGVRLTRAAMQKQFDLVLARARHMLEFVVGDEYPDWQSVARAEGACVNFARSNPDMDADALCALVDDCVEVSSIALSAPVAAMVAPELGNKGYVELGLRMIEQAIRNVQKSDIRLYEAELHRVSGVLLHQQDPHRNVDAKQTLHKSLAMAQTQGARMIELRAATSLSRLLNEERKNHEARQLLTPIYDWFTEGFDTPDLKEAKALLDQLS